MRNFQQILEAAGYTPETYSGRDMAGTECLSVALGNRSSSVARMFADVLEALEPDENEVAALAFRRMRTDNLGLGVVAYFPSIQIQ